MNLIESAVVFDCAGERLAGIVASNDQPGALGVVIVVGGPQYRVGSHRQFVLLARSLARAGYPTLRFDARGMGDSGGSAAGFERADQDVGAAIDTLVKHCSTVKRVVLWGLCDGASAALLYVDSRADPRVCGVCVANPWVRSEVTLARTHVRHYYGSRLREPAFWAKMLRGRGLLQAVTGFADDLRTSLKRQRTDVLGYTDRMARAWGARRAAILLLLSGRDLTAKEFLDHTRSSAAWSAVVESPHVERVDLPEADHTFSSAALRQAVEKATLAWLQGLQAAPS